MSEPPFHSSLSANLVTFGRLLREQGLLVGFGEQGEAVRVVENLGVCGRARLRDALRVLWATSPRDRAIFDEVFERFWQVWARGDEWKQTTSHREPDMRPPPPSAASLRSWLTGGAHSGSTGTVAIARFSPGEVLGRRDLRDLSHLPAREVEDQIGRIIRSIALRPSRRFGAPRRRGRLDLRRTVARYARSGGDLLEPVYRGPGDPRPDLLAFLDVSRSMELYTGFTLRLLAAFRMHARRIEAFTFGTRLQRITPQLRDPREQHLRTRLAEAVPDWAGGTRIGATLERFHDEWGRRLLRPSTVVLILSDGWDTGEPERLAESMRRLHRRSRFLIWLNPLMGHPGFEPETVGMRTVLPFVDCMHPCHDLASLRELARLLSRNPVRPGRRGRAALREVEPVGPELAGWVESASSTHSRLRIDMPCVDLQE